MFFFLNHKNIEIKIFCWYNQTLFIFSIVKRGLLDIGDPKIGDPKLL